MCKRANKQYTYSKDIYIYPNQNANTRINKTNDHHHEIDVSILCVNLFRCVAMMICQRIWVCCVCVRDGCKCDSKIREKAFICHTNYEKSSCEEEKLTHQIVFIAFHIHTNTINIFIYVENGVVLSCARQSYSILLQ